MRSHFGFTCEQPICKNVLKLHMLQKLKDNFKLVNGWITLTKRCIQNW